MNEQSAVESFAQAMRKAKSKQLIAKSPLILNNSSMSLYIQKTDILTSLWDYSISLIADLKDASMSEHAHHSYKVVVTLDNDLGGIIDGHTISNVRGFIVNKTVPHTFFGPDARVLVNFIEPDSLWGWQLRSLLKDKPWMNIDSVLAPEQYENVFPENYKCLSNDELIPYVNNFLNSIFPLVSQPNKTITDDRIKLALLYVEENLHKPLDLEDIASQISLSPDRVRHLFVKEMNIPFSQYVIWKRIKKIISTAIHEDKKLNETCIQYGFWDQPHFVKTFKRFFGLTPSFFFNNCRVLL